MEARSQWKGTPLEVIERFQSRCKRRADLDNKDALTGIAYDSQIAKLTIARAYHKTKPRIEIEIKEKLTVLPV
jgi:Holliday junction resolvase RusA-like endonuclease